MNYINTIICSYCS